MNVFHHKHAQAHYDILNGLFIDRSETTKIDESIMEINDSHYIGNITEDKSYLLRKLFCLQDKTLI